MDDTLGLLFVRVAKALRAIHERNLNAMGLYIGQERILLALADSPGMSSAGLAEALNVEPPTMTKALQRLNRAGLVERRPCHTDGRISRNFITPGAEALLPQIQSAWHSLDQRLLAGFSEDECQQLEGLLTHLLDNLSETLPK